MYLVSIIIPNYNHAIYLKKRIDSVLNQTYQNFEVIILDDCSTDHSIEIINQYSRHPKISHIILNKANSGSPFIQWQKGFELAQGNYIWIAESDDYASLDFLGEMMLPLLNNDNVGVAYADSNIIDADNVIHENYYKQFRNNTFKTNKWNDDYVKKGTDEIRENLFYECTINNTSAMIFKKNLLGFVDFNYLTKFKYCGDWFFFISLLKHCDIAYNKKSLNFFKQGTNNFAAGTKSTINYFKERFLVRYYFWDNFRLNFTKVEREKFYTQLGIEMRIQLNEIIKGKSSFVGTLRSFFLLRNINKNLFYVQFNHALKAYIWKN